MTARTTVPPMEFRHRLRLAMEYANVDPDVIAEQLLASRSSVYGWLKGPHRPAARKVARIAELCGVDEAWLATGTPSDQATSASPWRPTALDDFLSNALLVGVG